MIRKLVLLQVLIQVLYVLPGRIVKSQTTCQAGFTNSDGNCDECGLNNAPNLRSLLDTIVSVSSNGSKVVGGSIANENSWPAQALLKVTLSEGAFFICGGTLIKRNVILSAAHCIKNNLGLESYKWYLGAHDTSYDALSSGGVVKASVQRIIKHPQYNTDTKTSDIALFILDSPVQLNPKIQIACLPIGFPAFFPLPGSESWAAGWGNTAENGETSKYLKNVKLQVYDGCSVAGCGNDYRKNWDVQICSGDTIRGSDTCQGDSGGPLYVKGTVGGKTKYVLAGITSFGEGCGRIGNAGIYVRVVSFIDWITQNVGL